MGEILLDLNKPNWWFTVVIAGLIINFIANISFKLYEKYRATKSQKKREELKKRQEEREKIIETLANNSYGQGYYQFQTLDSQISAVRVFLIGLIFFIVPSNILGMFGSSDYFISIGFYLLGSLLIIQGFRIQNKASDKRDVLKASMKRQVEIRKEEKEEK